MQWQIVFKEGDYVLALRLWMHLHIRASTLGGDSSDECLAAATIRIEVAVHGIVLWPPDLQLLLPQVDGGLVEVHDVPVPAKPVNVLGHKLLLLRQLLNSGSFEGEMVLGGEKANAESLVMVCQSILVDFDVPIVSEPEAPLSQVEGHKFLQHRCAHEFLLLLSVEVLPPLFGIWVLQRQVAVSQAIAVADGQDSIQVQLQHVGNKLVRVNDVIGSSNPSIPELNHSKLQVIRDPWPGDCCPLLLLDPLGFDRNELLQKGLQTVQEHPPSI